MRRIPRSLVAVATVLIAAGSALPSAAEELPPGFTDGKPVGEEPSGPSAPTPERTTTELRTAEASTAAAATATQRYFGKGAFESVQTAVAGTSRSCGISNTGLTALVLAVVFAESSAATTAATAPSPMTLSRYDEWNGVSSTSMGTPENNYGLYAFRNPSTPYKRAFWHPGLGIWQYDTAGLGAPLTTIESMDVRVVAGAVASEMSRRYCQNESLPDDDQRAAAWAPWSGCSSGACEQYFQDMYPTFDNITRVDGIGPLGGVVPHTCSLQGVSNSLPCWYVEPRVGVIQGSTSWATLNPLDGGPWPTYAPPWTCPAPAGEACHTPAPISLPFYVIDRGATEERHWLREDTGYGIDIRAARNIGKDARPRSTQAGSGLTWADSSGLCDLDTGHGACVPIPPAGVSSAVISVGGSYLPRHLDAHGDGLGDVFWYSPTGPDYLWRGGADGTFTSTQLAVGSGYDDVLTGDIDGDGDDDIIFYDRSSGLTYLWRATGAGTFTSSRRYPGAGRRPFLLDLDADGMQEVFWYGPGSVSDAVWDWTGGGFKASARSIGGSYSPQVGDFDGNGRDDIVWYAPGTAADWGWLHKTAGGYLVKAYDIDPTFRTAVGDLDGDGKDDLLLHGPGSTIDRAWFGAAGGAFQSSAFTVSGSYLPYTVDLYGTGRDNVVWLAFGAPEDSMWTWNAARQRSTTPLVLPSTQWPLVGGYSEAGADGIVWYGPGTTLDRVWYR